MSEQPVRSSGDFIHNLKHGAASLPYDFRRNTGLVIELNLVAGRTLELLHETLSVARILHSGIDELRKNAPLVEGLRDQVRMTTSGGELLTGDLHPLHAVVIVNLCAALEAGIEDTLIVALRFRPGVISHLSQLGVERLTKHGNRDLTYAEAQQAKQKLETWARKPKQPAPSGWLRQLASVGLQAALSVEHSAALRELVYVRNCIVHRAHRADQDCVDRMSILHPQDGERIRVSLPAMGAYANAALTLASVVANAAQKPANFPSS
jgi:hypothetical protein